MGGGGWYEMSKVFRVKRVSAQKWVCGLTKGVVWHRQPGLSRVQRASTRQGSPMQYVRDHKGEEGIHMGTDLG